MHHRRGRRGSGRRARGYVYGATGERLVDRTHRSIVDRPAELGRADHVDIDAGHVGDVEPLVRLAARPGKSSGTSERRSTTAFVVTSSSSSSMTVLTPGSRWSPCAWSARSAEVSVMVGTSCAGMRLAGARSGGEPAPSSGGAGRRILKIGSDGLGAGGRQLPARTATDHRRAPPRRTSTRGRAPPRPHLIGARLAPRGLYPERRSTRSRLGGIGPDSPSAQQYRCGSPAPSVATAAATATSVRAGPAQPGASRSGAHKGACLVRNGRGPLSSLPFFTKTVPCTVTATPRADFTGGSLEAAETSHPRSLLLRTLEGCMVDGPSSADASPEHRIGFDSSCGVTFRTNWIWLR